MVRMIGILAAVDLLLLAAAWTMGGHWVVNTQVAYFTSSLVMGASMLSYARMVRGRLEGGAIPEMDERDTIDKMEDPYGVYDDTAVAETAQSAKEPDPAEIKAAIKEEKQRLKAQRRTPAQTLRDSRAAMSIYRLGAYGVLVFGFFYLRGNRLLEIAPYLVGLGLPIGVIVVVLMSRRGGGEGVDA